MNLQPLQQIAARDLVPEIPPYRYVGDLYGHIKEGILAIPEDVLFIGSPTRQVDNNWSVNVDMRIIKDRSSALMAIDDIVRDGEGTPSKRAEGHYGKFCQIWKGYNAAPFGAARPVVRNPRTRLPRGTAPNNVVLITDPTSLAVAELFNATYALMLRMLSQFFANAGETQPQRDAIRSATARLMSTTVRPIAEVLTALPATGGGDENAGPPFELYLPVLLAPEPRNRWTLLFESIDAVTDEAKRIGAAGEKAHRLAHIADTLRIMKRTLQEAARGDQ